LTLWCCMCLDKSKEQPNVCLPSAFSYLPCEGKLVNQSSFTTWEGKPFQKCKSYLFGFRYMIFCLISGIYKFVWNTNFYNSKNWHFKIWPCIFFQMFLY
jgi:hypothetical protein